jgi:hypothetical protein
VIIAILASVFGVILWFVRLVVPRKKKAGTPDMENTDNSPEHKNANG